MRAGFQNLWLALFLVGLTQGSSQSVLSKKFALVIGVKAYKYVPHLQNSLNDAHDISSILKEKGFRVIELYDPRTKREMQESIKEYFNLIQDQKEAAGLVFYSGHGMQVDGINYLIPSFANPQIKADLDDQCVKMDYVMEAIAQAGNPLNIFIIDACRNNPFPGFSRSTEKGLGVVDTPNGSYIVFATKPGAVASDGTGRNGLFTSKLLKYIDTPGLNIEQVFKRVASDVKSESNGSQHPWIASDYTGDFFFTNINTDSNADTHDANNKLDERTSNSNDFFISLKNSADNGNAISQNQLAVMYEEGKGVEKDFSLAFKYFKLSADQGNPYAEASLGIMYQNGLGVDKDYLQAARFFQLSANNGNSLGQTCLAYLYLNGFGVEKSVKLALKLYLLAADQGDVIGQYSSAKIYLERADFFMAEKYFIKAADQGFAEAQCSLGAMYRLGQGVQKDYVQAVNYFRKAAEQGNGDGQSWLGYMYENGFGVQWNKAEAINWYKKASSQGNEYAKTRLVILLK
jgi:TPR repeat protein